MQKPNMKQSEDDIATRILLSRRIHTEARTEEKEKEDGTKETVEVTPAKDQYKIIKRPVPINDTNPLWTKHPKRVHR